MNAPRSTPAQGPADAADGTLAAAVFAVINDYAPKPLALWTIRDKVAARAEMAGVTVAYRDWDRALASLRAAGLIRYQRSNGHAGTHGWCRVSEEAPRG